MNIFSPFYDLIAWPVQYILPFVAVIAPVVFFHELGHFAIARLFGVRVETFSIGFGPAIVSWMDRKGTRWKISWFPLGGYVKFFGDLDAASTPDRDAAATMTAAERAVAFPFKPLYQRALIVAAGPIANFVLAIAILATFLLVFGDTNIPARIAKVMPGMPAQAAGFHVDDLVVDIDGRAIASFGDMTTYIGMRPGEPLVVTVVRGGARVPLHVTPKLVTIKDPFGEIEKVGQLGVELGGRAQVVKYGPLGALQEACHMTWQIVQASLDMRTRLFSSSAAVGQLHGPLGIAKISAQVAQINLLSLIKLAAFISVSIGLVNLFPIPLLDGGHLLYYGFEAVLGRPLGARAQDVGFRLGLAVMLGLMLLATWNDLVRLKLF